MNLNTSRMWAGPTLLKCCFLLLALTFLETSSALVPRLWSQPSLATLANREAPTPRRAAPLFASPRNESEEGNKLDEFLVLMGRCYGFAGLAHAADFASTNALPAMAGLPPYSELGVGGMALGAVWCAIGIVQPALSGRTAKEAGLVAYGLYEVFLTVATGSINPDGLGERLAAAIGLQLVVVYCYFQLRRQSLGKVEREI